MPSPCPSSSSTAISVSTLMHRSASGSDLKREITPTDSVNDALPLQFFRRIAEGLAHRFEKPPAITTLLNSNACCFGRNDGEPVLPVMS